VPNVTNINSGVLSAMPWPSRPGASSLRASFPGADVLGVGSGTGPSAAVVRSAPRVVRDKVALDVPVAPQPAPSAQQVGQTNIHNYMTGVFAVGEGASGPPPDRESA
jgi:hypothetical protein